LKLKAAAVLVDIRMMAISERHGQLRRHPLAESPDLSPAGMTTVVMEFCLASAIGRVGSDTSMTEFMTDWDPLDEEEKQCVARILTFGTITILACASGFVPLWCATFDCEEVEAPAEFLTFALAWLGLDDQELSCVPRIWAAYDPSHTLEFGKALTEAMCVCLGRGNAMNPIVVVLVEGFAVVNAVGAAKFFTGLQQIAARPAPKRSWLRR
jgi:hypothetical protein